MPAYFQGILNGSIAVTRLDGATPQMSGDIAVSDARLPFNAFLDVKGGSKTSPSLPEIAIANLRIAAGKNVRVQSANVDVGATGDVALTGTLRAPKLTGSFRSTGGTLSFYRTFNLETANVDFDPSSGLVPDVSAVATTYVANPPTAVRMRVSGPVTNMNLDLSSDPSYDKQQILGLLVGAQQFGAVAGVNSTGGTGFSATSAAQQVALGQVNTLFTRTMLEPLSASVASAFGFTSVQITTDIQTGLGLNAVKAFGKNVNAIFAQSFGYPKVQAVTLEAHPDPATGYRLTWYTATGPSLFAAQPQTQPVASNVLDLNPATTLLPATGTNGIGLSYVRKFP
jgi:autotransporter translocation and assembly factor TamB